MANRWGKWTCEQIEQLKKLYENNLSAGQIAAEMNCGYTRNAVIGKIHRIGLPLRGQRKAAPRQRKKTVRTETIRIVRANSNSNSLRIIESATLETARLRCAEVEPRNVALVDLSLGGCRYPYGDGPFVFCDHPTIDGRAYCDPHHDLTRVKPRSIDDAVREARRRRMRGLNFRRALLEAAP